MEYAVDAAARAASPAGPSSPADSSSPGPACAAAGCPDTASPQEEAGLLSGLFFWWVEPLLVTGAGRALTARDLTAYNPRGPVRVPSAWRAFCTACTTSLTRDYVYENQDAEPPGYARMPSIGYARMPSVAFLHNTSHPEQPGTTSTSPIALRRSFLRLHGQTLIRTMLLYGIYIATQLASPLILKQLVLLAQDRFDGHLLSQQEVWAGVCWAAVLPVMIMLGSLARAHALFQTCEVLLQVRAVLTGLIFQKATRLKLGADPGEVINLLSSDTQRFLDGYVNLHAAWSSPCVVLLGAYLLWREVGHAAWAGLALMVVMMPINTRIGLLQRNWQNQTTAWSDKRLSIFNEILCGIGVIKLFGWEEPFLGKLAQARARELRSLLCQLVLETINNALLLLLPWAVAVLVFALFIASEGAGAMTAPRVFTTLSLISTIRFPFLLAPQAISAIISLSIALTRVETFLARPERGNWQKIDSSHEQDRQKLDSSNVQDISSKLNSSHTQDISSSKLDSSYVLDSISGSSNPQATARQLVNKEGRDEPGGVAGGAGTSQGVDIVLEGVCLGWEGKVYLREVSCAIAAGELVGVVGPVGVGKSTLLLGLLREAEISAGRLTLRARTGAVRLAYMPQHAFIVNATLRENITFGLPFDAGWYEAVLFACGLLPDLPLLSHADQTLLGAEGVTLSGGQKQRVALARACYDRAANLVLLDDPLSALDARVAAHVFNHAILGLLRGKTRLFATHALQFVPCCDRTLLLDWPATIEPVPQPTHADDRAGRCAGGGTYNELVAQSARFRSLLQASCANPALSSAGVAVPLAVSNRDAAAARNFAAETAAQATGPVGCFSVEQGWTRSALVRHDVQDEHSTGSLNAGVVSVYLLGGRPWQGWLLAGWVALWYVAVQLVFTLADFWLAHWTSQTSRGLIAHHTSAQDWEVWTPSQGWRPALRSDMFYLVVYACLIGALGLGYVVRGVSVTWETFCGSRHLHELFVSSLLYQTLSFFEHNPVGSLLNRAGRDLFVVDNVVSKVLQDTLATWTGSVGMLAVIALVMPIDLLLFLPLGLLYYRTQRYYRQSSRQLQRLENVSRSPLFNHFAEMLNGLSTVRALGAAHLYLAQGMTYLEVNQRVFLLKEAAGLWLGVRLELLGALLLLSVCLLPVLGPAWQLPGLLIKPGQTGLLIVNALNLLNYMNWALVLFTRLETQLASAERLTDLTPSLTSLPLEPDHAKTEETLTELASRGPDRDLWQGQDSQDSLPLAERSAYMPPVLPDKAWSQAADQALATLPVDKASRQDADKAARQDADKGLATAAPATATAKSSVQKKQSRLQHRTPMEQQTESTRRFATAQWEQVPPLIRRWSPAGLPGHIGNPDIPATWPGRGNVHFDQVWLRYGEQGEPVLRGVSFRVQAGQRCAIIGRTGCGKSSLLRALFRLTAISQGRITIDGWDVSRVPLALLRERLAIVPQDPVLFSVSVRENLDPSGRYNESKLWGALANARLDKLVRSLPDGLDCQVSPDGFPFSAGQRQLLCLARALLKQTQVLCLDEATANVDVETDKVIQDVLRTECKGRTVLTIAHRLSTVLDYDLVLVFQAGQLVEQGAPAQLAARPDSLFASLQAEDTGSRSS
eukprot:g59147.t1